MKLYRNPSGSQRGAILILVMVFATGLVTLAYSSFSTIEASFRISEQDTDALQAELAAQSGLEYGRLRLGLDKGWPGIGGSGVEFAPDIYFTCTPDVPIGQTAGTIDLQVTGEAGDGYRELSARMTPVGGVFEAEVALGLLGGDDYIIGSDIVGDLLVTDAMSSVYDWVYDEDEEGSYVLAGPDSIEGTELNCSWVNGTIYKYTNIDYAGWPADEVVIDTPHMMPEWDLDVYLPENGASSSDYQIFYNKTKFQYKTYYKPVVVINDPGMNLYVKNCRFYGGLVMYCPKDYDLRNGPRQTLKVKNSMIGNRCQPLNIGIIAPGSELQQISGSWSTSYGFSIYHDIKRMRCFHQTGMAYVVNRVKLISSSEFIYDEYVYKNLPPGITLENEMSGYSIASIGEDLD
jgi:hypothetical protein